MNAFDLARELPVLPLTSTAGDAAIILAETGCADLVVAAADGRMLGTISAIDLLGLLVPPYLQEDPVLGRMWADDDVQRSLGRAQDRALSELVGVAAKPSEHVRRLRSIEADANLVELAVEFIEHHAQLLLIEGSSPAMFVRVTDVAAAIASAGRDAGA